MQYTENIAAIIFIIAGGSLLLAGIIIAINKRPLMVEGRYIKLHSIFALTGVVLFAYAIIFSSIGGSAGDTLKYIIASLLLISFVLVIGLLLFSTNRSYYFISVSNNFNDILKRALDNLFITYVPSDSGYNLNTLNTILESNSAMFGLSRMINMANDEGKDILRQVSLEAARIYQTKSIHLGSFFWLNVSRLIFSGIFIMTIGIIILTILKKGV